MNQNIRNIVNEVDRRHRKILIDQFVESLNALPDNEFNQITKIIEDQYKKVGAK